MSRLLAVILAAVLAFAVVPGALAQEAPSQTPTETTTEPAPEPTASGPLACANPDDLEVLAPGTLQSTIATPVFDGPGTEYKEFLVDLSATSLEATAPVDITMTWDVRVNDYDLGATSARSDGVSENYQPFDPVEEAVNVVAGHCEVIEVRAINFLAPVDMDTLTLAFTVGTVTTPVAQ